MSFKKKIARIRVHARRHVRKSQSRRVTKLQLQTNRDLKEIARLEALAQTRAEAIKARQEKERLLAPEKKARQERLVKAHKQAEKGLDLFVKAVKAIKKHANKKR